MKSNRCPMTDVCLLRSKEKVYDSSKHFTETVTEREIFCSISDGVTRSEYYAAYKAGVALSATAEVYEDDYEGELQLKHEGKIYDIVRVYPSGYGTFELSLREVVR